MTKDKAPPFGRICCILLYMLSTPWVEKAMRATSMRTAQADFLEAKCEEIDVHNKRLKSNSPGAMAFESWGRQNSEELLEF